MDSDIKITNIQQLPERRVASEGGAYELYQKDVSLELGGIKDAGPEGDGHPFDLCQVRVPPGKKNWPLHVHTAQWEIYVVLSGAGTVRGLTGEPRPVQAGDCWMVKPGKAGQILNTGAEDLVFQVIATNQPTDAIYYPDSGKYMVKPWRKCFRMQEVDYYEGEE